jgi:glycosyltransferase involved in cell wall biosynthesis
MQKPFRILALFDYNSFTGFSTVSKNLVTNWKKIFGENMLLDIVAVNYFGDGYSEGPNVRVISAKRNDVAKDDFGRYVFMRSLMDIDYDVIFILQDLGVVVPMIPHIKKIKDDKKKENRKQFKSILYFPVDFALTPNLGIGIEFFDSLATFTDFGKQNVNRLRPDLKTKVRVVPHGNNFENFFVMPESEVTAFRKSYFGENADKFIIGNVNRNQSRKDIPNTIFGFLEYWEEYNKNSFLYLHMNPKDPMGWHLRTILAQTPLREGIDFMFPPKEDYEKGADISKLNAIYNSLDVFLSTATGGGWELTVTEAMSARKPVIIPKHTSFQYLGGANGERAYFLDTLYPCVSMIDNVIRFQSDLYEISETLNYVYNDIQHKNPDLSSRVDNAYKFIEKHKWQDIAKSFAEEIKKLL